MWRPPDRELVQSGGFVVLAEHGAWVTPSGPALCAGRRLLSLTDVGAGRTFHTHRDFGWIPQSHYRSETVPGDSHITRAGGPSILLTR